MFTFLHICYTKIAAKYFRSNWKAAKDVIEVPLCQQVSSYEIIFKGRLSQQVIQ